MLSKLVSTFLCAALSLCVAAQKVSGMPTSGGYTPPALTLQSFLTEDSPLGKAMLRYAGTGDSATFRKFVETQATSGDIGAQLLLAEQYIPEQCTFEPNQDVPHCGKDGNEPPHVVFRQNPLGIETSYEYAAQWLERASVQGSGEASEILAQLITRMLANGHATSYTVGDSKRLHALARAQGFDVEPISVSCDQLFPSTAALTVESKTLSLGGGNFPQGPFTQEELSAIRKLKPTGNIRVEGSSSGGDSTLLSRPEDPVVRVRVVLDHDPGKEIHLPIPAHRDVVYVQQGDTFIQIPSEGPNLPRFLSVMPQTSDLKQISIYKQNMDGGFSGTFCARF